MRSKTSFFNKTIFLKSITRFWPVWGSYFAIWVLVLPLSLVNSGYSAIGMQSHVLSCAQVGGTLLGAVYGCFAAMAVWSFLYTTRAAYGTACLPLRREGLFLSVMPAGLLPLLAANLVVMLLACAAGGGRLPFATALEWFAAVSLIDLFFYAFATLCAFLTGSIVVLPLVYAVLNFTVAAVVMLVQAVANSFVYGLDSVGAYGAGTRWLTPVMNYFETVGTEAILNYDTSSAYYLEKGHFETIGYRLGGWHVLIVYAVVALVMLAGALLLFRRRKMETAGDVVAVKALKPVFRWCMGLGCALALGCLLFYILGFDNSSYTPKAAAFFALLVFMLLGAFVGWFIAEMLIQKSFRVFRGKTWAGLGICGIAVVALMLGMRFDLFGVERRVPAADSIESVYVSSQGESALFRTPAGVGAAMALHEQIIADRDWNEQDRAFPDGYDGYYCSINYYLKNGETLRRRYNLLYDADAPERGDMLGVQALLNTPEAVANRKETSVPLTRETIVSGQISAAMTAAEWAEALDYDSPEAFILCELRGLSRAYVQGMDAPARTAAAVEALESNLSYGDEYFVASAGDLGVIGGADGPTEVYVTGDGRPVVAPTLRPPYDYGGLDPEHVDWNEVFVTYRLSLNADEAAALYLDCLLPDMEDDTLGHVWIVPNTGYAETVYRAIVEIEAREAVEPETVGAYNEYAVGAYRHGYFETYPTVDSARTNAYIAARGLTLHLVEELG